MSSTVFEEAHQKGTMIDEGPNLQAPAFEPQYVHKKRSIHVPIYFQGIEATVLTDCGAIDNFIDKYFTVKRGLKPTPRTCRLGEGVTRVTHSFQSEVDIVGKVLPSSFHIMNGKI